MIYRLNTTANYAYLVGILSKQRMKLYKFEIGYWEMDEYDIRAHTFEHTINTIEELSNYIVFYCPRFDMIKFTIVPTTLADMTAFLLKEDSMLDKITDGLLENLIVDNWSVYLYKDTVRIGNDIISEDKLIPLIKQYSH